MVVGPYLEAVILVVVLKEFLVAGLALLLLLQVLPLLGGGHGLQRGRGGQGVAGVTVGETVRGRIEVVQAQGIAEINWAN